MPSQHRIALHRIPELDCHLPETAAYVRGVLSGLHCRVFSPWESAVCAYFDYGQPETVAFRSDMDALPICETTGSIPAKCTPADTTAIWPSCWRWRSTCRA